jgi:aminopeptidase N
MAERPKINSCRVRFGLWEFLLAVTALITIVSANCMADMYPRQPGIKISKYLFDVTLGDESDELTVKDTIDLQLLADSVRGLELDLCQLVVTAHAPDHLNPCLVPQPRAPRGEQASLPSPAPTSVGFGMTVTAVTIGDKELEFRHQNDRLHIGFPQPTRAGQKLTLIVSYHGKPATGLFIGKNKYGDRVFFTDNWSNKARNWLATIDHISVKAAKTISVTAPRKYQVISNGLLKEQTDLPGDLRRTVWEESLPIPSWQFSLAVAQMSVNSFGRADNVQFSAWLFPQDRDAGLKALDPLTQSVFDFYSSHIGPYSYEKLAQVEAAGSGGATEPATTIFYYSGFGAAAHEMAHQWFGNAVTEADWDDVWLSEGFATYFNLLYTEHTNGRDAFLNGVRRTRAAAVNYALAHPADTVVHNNLQNDSEVFFNSTQIYQGGAMVLHTLRGVLGDQKFWAGIRLYSNRFRNASATTDDFRHAMEDACHASGDCAAENEDLSWFFHEWLNRGGILDLKGNWHYDAQTKQLQVVLDQAQTQGLYRMPIEIGITVPFSVTSQPEAAGRRVGQTPTTLQTRIATMLIDKQHNVLTTAVDTEPSDVQVDPNLWVPMMQVAFEKH